MPEPLGYINLHGFLRVQTVPPNSTVLLLAVQQPTAGKGCDSKELPKPFPTASPLPKPFAAICSSMAVCVDAACLSL